MTHAIGNTAQHRHGTHQDRRKQHEEFEDILRSVRSFYTDLHGWAVEGSEKRAPWVAPCPVPDGALCRVIVLRALLGAASPLTGGQTVIVLRHAGIRIEELLELTHLSIRQYQRPNGEVIALLMIAPFKTDRERVIPVSAELFAVIAAIIRRHTPYWRGPACDFARDGARDKSVTNSEWSEFEEHFDRRKAELGSCARPYGSVCQHEHSCLRCPMLAINPKMLPGLDEIEDDLLGR